ncbi:MAG: phage tail protein [Dehalococcoidia bacterium]
MNNWLVDQLPRAMAEDPFLRRYMSIFQHLGNSLREQVDGVGMYLDIDLAPPEFVRWMGTWMGLVVEHDISDPAERDRRSRELVRTSGILFLQRGTKAGLEGLLTSLTGAAARVSDTGGVFRTGQAPLVRRHITVEVDDAGGIDEQSLLMLVRDEIPVDATFELQIGSRLIEADQPTEMGRLNEMAQEQEQSDRRAAEEAGVIFDEDSTALQDQGDGDGTSDDTSVSPDEEPSGEEDPVPGLLDDLEHEDDGGSPDADGEDHDQPEGHGENRGRDQ